MVGYIFSTKKAFILDSNHFSKPFYKEHFNHPAGVFKTCFPAGNRQRTLTGAMWPGRKPVLDRGGGFAQ
jgi:hypothetical protein